MGVGKKPIATRTLWVEALAKELLQPPFGDFSIDAVAKKLGVTKGSFYHYFSDKDAALHALVEEWREELDRVTPIDEWASTKTLQEFLEAIVKVEASPLRQAVYLLLPLLPMEHSIRQNILSIHLERNKRYHAIFDRYHYPSEQADALLYATLMYYVGFTLFKHSGLLSFGGRAPITDECMQALLAQMITRASTLV